jgi:type VII secretion protein EccB
MATKRDLVEAHQFGRRRLVTAFVSGAPGGREVEPARPGRALVGGLALALLVVAGGAVTGMISGRDVADWKQSGLVISRDRGQPYLVSVPEHGPLSIRPLVNITSARLILGPDAAPTYVSDRAIEAEKIGEPIGILDAPANVPAPDDLIESGWTACTSGGAVKLSVSRTPGVRAAPTVGFLVESHGTRYVVAAAAAAAGEQANAYTYALPADRGAQDNLLRDLGLGVGADAVPVSSDWLALWPAGASLSWPSLGIAGAGSRVSYAGAGSGIPGDARVGDVVTTPEESVVLAPRGPVPLDAFSLAVLRSSSIDGRPVRELRTDRLDVARLAPIRSTHWPGSRLTPVGGELCARLTSRAGRAPLVALGTRPTAAASAAGVAPGQRAVSVSAAGGAYVLSGGWSDTGGSDDGSAYLVDANGISYPLVGPDAATNLGFDGYPAPVVPDSWVKLFDPGVNLSVGDALCPPVRSSDQPCA